MWLFAHFYQKYAKKRVNTGIWQLIHERVMYCIRVESFSSATDAGMDFAILHSLLLAAVAREPSLTSQQVSFKNMVEKIVELFFATA